ncbi:MAG: hypothetical protein M1820_005145 [Bogoriella megaspora]|nr:MAG: hypothetical protein M1820_005145 [Bogoriella megaspora]
MANIVSLNQIPTLKALYAANKLNPVASPSATPNPRFNDQISLITNDITKLQTDAIVNAANESLLGGGGVDGAIHRAAGPELVEECELLDGCDTGDAKITSAYELPSKRVIHAVGPIYHSTKRQGKHTSLLQSCYRKSLELAVANRCKSIAFSALSTGVYGYPSGEAAETALGEVRRFLEGPKGDKLDRVVFCCFMDKDTKAYEEWLPHFFPPAQSGESGEAVATSAEQQQGANDNSEYLITSLPDTPTAILAAEDSEPPTTKQQHKAEFESPSKGASKVSTLSGTEEVKTDKEGGKDADGGASILYPPQVVVVAPPEEGMGPESGRLDTSEGSASVEDSSKEALGKGEENGEKYAPVEAKKAKDELPAKDG